MHAAQNSSASATAAPGTDARYPLALIAAVAANGVIGAHNQLPWRLPADLRRFRALTTGHAVIMGRKTWESLPRPLPDRQNIVVTRDRQYTADGADVATTLDEALALVRMPPPIYCIGGGEVYRAALPRAGMLHLTEIEQDFAGDVTFPPIDLACWREASRESGTSDDGANVGLRYHFVTYARR